MYYRRFIVALYLLPFSAIAQHYTAVNGSSYTGSLNVHQNPSAIVNVPQRWDITLFGIQDKHTTNAVEVFNYSLLSNPLKSQYAITNGQFKRHGDLNMNLNIVNTRIALNKKSAIGFGATIRSYLTLNTSPYNFVDTLHRFGDFFSQNEGAPSLWLNMSSSSWAELYATFGKTVFDNEYGRLNAGITLKLNRGLAGAFAQLADGRFTRSGITNPVEYLVTSASLDLGYSSNFDRWDSAKNFNENTGNFLSFTEGGGSFDIGFEYLVKLESVNTVFEEDDYFDYDWKIGLSLLDIGYGQYHFGKYSTRAVNIRPNTTDLILDRVFDSTINNLGDLRDSLSSVFNTTSRNRGKFRVAHPARLVLNVDKFINGAFFINADLSVNLSPGSTGTNKGVKDINLLTLTPRWETRKKGFYLPFYYNYQDQLWVGGAVRVGPILFGIHNWSNIFSRKKIQRGGGYLAVILRSPGLNEDKADRRLNCYW